MLKILIANFEKDKKSTDIFQPSRQLSKHASSKGADIESYLHAFASDFIAYF